jgi:hypothetical protein
MWKLMVVESATTLQSAVTGELGSGFNVMKNETLYNLSLESPLLRDVDFLDNQSIAQVWRGNFDLTVLTRFVVAQEGEIER